jgi:lipopolysaccharide/colanic/teichoic acid biosynthesis glycosyltransferase
MPQLFNVIRGEMSLVARPGAPEFVHILEDKTPIFASVCA